MSERDSYGAPTQGAARVYREAISNVRKGSRASRGRCTSHLIWRYTSSTILTFLPSPYPLQAPFHFERRTIDQDSTFVCSRKEEIRVFYFYLHIELVDDSELDARNRISLRVVGEGRCDPRLCNEGSKAKRGGGTDVE